MLRAYPTTLLLLVLLLASSTALAGPYAPAAGQAGTTAIAKTDSAIVAWAATAALIRGPQNISAATPVPASFGAATDAVGGNSGVVSLGDGGSITLGFAQAIRNGSGADFAVFENSFADTFLELAFVEVSSDGENFFRFDAVSLTPVATQVAGFGALDPTNLNNLAGKYRGGFGTPFDLQELAQRSPLLNVDAVTHVRLIDVVGSINPQYATLDSLGNIVNDPWTTPFPSGGFDLDDVGVINAVPEPGSFGLLMLGGISVWLRRIRLRAKR